VGAAAGTLSRWRGRRGRRAQATEDEGFEYPHQGTRLPRFVHAILDHGPMLALVTISLMPLYLMVTASLQQRDDFVGTSFAPPANPTFDNYATAWNELGFQTMFFNSAVLSISSAALCTATGALAAYGFTRFRFLGRGVLLGVVIGLMAVPATVVIVPIFLLASDLGLVNTYQGGIIVLAGFMVPFSVFLLYSFFKDQPNELFEAADVDGASHWLQFRRIALPLARPVLITNALITAIFAWNDLLIPLILWQSEDLQTLMTGLAQLGPSRTGIRDLPLLMAAVAISVLPLMVLYVLGRRKLIRGLAEGTLR
jgi:ABC-type glycerol-3-phosphate transport system permease component